MNRDEFVRLLTPEATRLLAEVGRLEAKADVVRLVSRLRAAGHDATLVAAVLTQARKLGDELEARRADLAAATQAAILETAGASV